MPPFLLAMVEKFRPTTRKGDVWSNYDMCIMIDGVEKACCKKCMKFYNPGSNSTLRTHKSGCNAVSENDTSQGTIGADGQVFIFDNDAVRLDFTKFVIQQALPFNHFDNVKLTEIIKRRLQPRYQHVSRTTLRSDAFKLWETAKKDIIDGFRDYKYGVSITTDTWTAPHGHKERGAMLTLGVIYVTLSSATSDVTYTSVYTDSEPGRAFLAESDFEEILEGVGFSREDPKEYEDDETEDGPVDYLMDGGDDGDDGDDDDGDSSRDDARD
ncbi:hypothetical protein Tco_0941789 [Tanacetum coccineum]|uniref:BED-type domain-containing protein n=1 Tax=Tanacetum coccineum TaxID=301880 RepID=A0ABQ5DXU5_9ASTR